MKKLLALVAALAALPAATAAAQAPSPGISPPGANDWSCVPSAAHPEPLVLVHGTFGDMTVSWNTTAPRMALEGYCVYALDYGDRGMGPIADSAQQLAGFVDQVLAATGAAKVDLVGHSQGGMMARYYVKNLGGDQRVDDLVGLAPSNHGTTNPAAPWGSWGDCQSCVEQVAGSAFLTALNAGDESPGAVSYTQVETRYDEVVTPYTSAFLADDGENVTNVLVQDSCAADASEHLTIVGDPVAWLWVRNALDRPGAADPAYRPGCSA
jgi:triacylglycerol esterase/lipase EstA (alpha/beta hydrolase family)